MVKTHQAYCFISIKSTGKSDNNAKIGLMCFVHLFPCRIHLPPSGTSWRWNNSDGNSRHSVTGTLRAFDRWEIKSFTRTSVCEIWFAVFTIEWKNRLHTQRSGQRSCERSRLCMPQTDQLSSGNLAGGDQLETHHTSTSTVTWCRSLVFSHDSVFERRDSSGLVSGSE